MTKKKTECVCPSVRSGDLCEINLCSQCQNGGSCRYKANEVECICPGAFYGKYCESSK